ncbi:unnamed protein product [Amoebophrya sp. A25]|nr:unnamed protein product [Amoebophrya sp. A25]|eukprot:GSA25T00027034001.1
MQGVSAAGAGDVGGCVLDCICNFCVPCCCDLLLNGGGHAGEQAGAREVRLPPTVAPEGQQREQPENRTNTVLRPEQEVMRMGGGDGSGPSSRTNQASSCTECGPAARGSNGGIA